MSLKLRLNLLISAVLAFAMLAWAFYVVLSARENVRAELRSTVTLAGHLLAHGEGGASLDLVALTQIRHLRIEIRDSGGNLLATNRPAEAPRPDAAPEWFAALVSPAGEGLGELRRMVMADGRIPAELVVRPDPSYEVDEVWSYTLRLAQVAALLFVAVNALVYWTLDRALRPVARILDALGRMERGDLQARLPPMDLPELNRIGGAFNRMAEALDGSITRNRSLARQLIRVQEEERRGIARELHDELGQSLTAIEADAAAILDFDPVPDPIRESARAILDVTGNVMDIVRGMLRRLRPDVLDSLGLAEALVELVDGWRQRNPGIEVDLRIAGPIPDPGDATGITAYRVVQEGLTNAARHAQAGRVKIEVSCSGQRLEIGIADDGAGMREGLPRRGFGLAGMRERVEGLGGTLAVESEPGRGVALRASLPLAAGGTATA